MNYSVLDPDSVNRRVVLLEGNEPAVRGVLWASEESQVCMIDQKNCGLTDEHAIGMIDLPFKIIDMRTGGEGKPDISTLFNTQSAVTVLGGAPVGADHIKRLPQKYKKRILTVNHHHTVGDFHVFADRYKAAMIEGSGKRISCWGDLSDYSMDARVTGTWFHRNSTFLALWVACCMAPTVVLAGFELKPDRACPSLEHHLDLWRRAKAYLPHGRKVLAIAGTPLEELFRGIKLK